MTNKTLNSHSASRLRLDTMSVKKQKLLMSTLYTIQSRWFENLHLQTPNEKRFKPETSGYFCSARAAGVLK